MTTWITPIEARTGIDLPALRTAIDYSVEHLNEAKNYFATSIGHGDELDIVVCGSLARQEMSGASDFDYLIIAHGLVEDATRFRAYRSICREWCARREVKPPGPTGIFGPVVSASDLVERIGLEHDTNASLTRRIILLEESVSLLNPDRHRKFLKVTLGRYLTDDRDRTPDVPRFLVNDICRYWRTVAVDYQAKVWERLDPGDWAVRYLKLRISRKLTFVASLVPALLVPLDGPESSRDYLMEHYGAKPPLARLGELVRIYEDDDRCLGYLREIFSIADRFNGLLADLDWRTEVSALRFWDTAQKHSGFKEMADASGRLQKYLELLLLDEHTELGRIGRKYLAF